MVEQGLASVHKLKSKGGPPRCRHPHRRVRVRLPGGRPYLDRILGTTLGRAITPDPRLLRRERVRASARYCLPRRRRARRRRRSHDRLSWKSSPFSASQSEAPYRSTMRITTQGGDCAAIYAAAHRAGEALHRQGEAEPRLVRRHSRHPQVEDRQSGMPSGSPRTRSRRDLLRARGMGGARILVSRRRNADPRARQRQADPALVRPRLHRPGLRHERLDRGLRRTSPSPKYDGRAEVEPAIGELKSGWGIGKIPSQDFRANHAVFLLKLLAHNLMRRFVRWTAPHLSTWRVPWLRRALINVPGRLLRSGRRWTLRVPPKSSLRLD